MTTQKNPEHLAEISPVLHSIDVMHYQIRAYSTNDEGRYHIVQEMLTKSTYAKIYTGASIDLLRPLVKKKHEPSMQLYNQLMQNN